jgi:hypothetical protein
LFTLSVAVKSIIVSVVLLNVVAPDFYLYVTHDVPAMPEVLGAIWTGAFLNAFRIFWKKKGQVSKSSLTKSEVP